MGAPPSRPASSLCRAKNKKAIEEMLLRLPFQRGYNACRDLSAIAAAATATPIAIAAAGSAATAAILRTLLAAPLFATIADVVSFFFGLGVAVSSPCGPGFLGEH